MIYICIYLYLIFLTEKLRKYIFCNKIEIVSTKRSFMFNAIRKGNNPK